MLSLLLATTLAAFAPAQVGEPTNFNVLAMTAFVIDDPTLVKELDLKEDQVKALREHGKKWVEDFYKLSGDQRYGRKRGEYSVANEKAIAKILDEKQLSLLRKRLLWEACLRFGEYRTLRYEDVSRELALTPEQMEKLRNAEAPADVLTADQKKKWNEMRGPRPTGTLKISNLTSERSFPTEANPEHLMLLVLPVVQQELKLNDKQKGVVEEQVKKWLKDAPPVLYGKPDELKKLIDVVEKAVDESLDVGQRKRLEQLTRQRKVYHVVGYFWLAAFRSEEFRKDIALTEDQKKKISTLSNALFRDLVKAAARAEKGDELYAEGRTVTAAHQEALLKLLDVDQRKKLDELYGEAFGRRLARVARHSLAEEEYPGPKPVVLVLLADMSNETISKELKLSKETQAELAKLNKEVQSYFTRTMTPAEQREEKKKAYEDFAKKVEALIGKEAYQRAREMVLQMIDDTPEGFYEYNSRLLCHWTDIVTALKLTENQLDQLKDGFALRDVLNKEQRDQYGKLCGEAIKEQPRRTNSLGGGAARKVTSTLVTLPVIARELKFSEEQQTKLRAWVDEAEDISRRSTIWREPDRREKAARQLSEQLDTILTREQRTRLRQIEYQLSARQVGLLSMVMQGESGKELNPTADEKTNLEQLAHQRQVVYRALGPYMMSLIPDKETDFHDVIDYLNAAENARVEKLLGEETKKRLKGLFGDPFAALTNTMWAEMQESQTSSYRVGEFGPPY